MNIFFINEFQVIFVENFKENLVLKIQVNQQHFSN